MTERARADVPTDPPACDDGRMFARFGLPATVDGERGGYDDATR